MAGALTDLSVAARFAIRTIGKRLRGEIDAAPDLAAFRLELDRALDSLGEGVASRRAWVELPATEPPWRDTGFDIAPEREVTIFCAGRVHASKALDIWIRPDKQIWTRVGHDGEVHSSSRATNTFDRGEAGRLYLGNYFPNDWISKDGEKRFQNDRVYGDVSGENWIAIVEWAGDAQAGLEALVAAGDPGGLASGELERRSGVGRPPEGWHYLWSLGEGEVYRGAGANAIECEVQGEVGILQKPVDFPFEPGCTIEWDWQVDELPGVMREDSLPSHDYLSIAVEFDTGWDITYYWSTELAPETGYVCPLPNWKHREYHVVVRRGDGGLGELHHESRDLHRDHAVHLAAHSADPTRIVGVWLIANSIFARKRGAGRFANIRLRSGERELQVL